MPIIFYTNLMSWKFAELISYMSITVIATAVAAFVILKCQMETIMSCKNMQLHAWWQAQSVQYVVIKFSGSCWVLYNFIEEVFHYS